MDRYIDVIRRVIELTYTMEEGLEYAQKMFLEIEYNEVSIILKDIMDGLKSIEDSMQPIISMLPINNIVLEGMKFEEELNKNILIFGNKDVDLKSIRLEEKLLPAFLSWKYELERILKPYTLS